MGFSPPTLAPCHLTHSLMALVPAICYFTEASLLARQKEEGMGLSPRAACALDLRSPGFGASSLLPVAAARLAGHRKENGTVHWCSAVPWHPGACLRTHPAFAIPCWLAAAFLAMQRGWGRGDGTFLTCPNSWEPKLGLHTIYPFPVDWCQKCISLSQQLCWSGGREGGRGNGTFPGAICAQEPSYPPFSAGFSAGSLLDWQGHMDGRSRSSSALSLRSLAYGSAQFTCTPAPFNLPIWLLWGFSLLFCFSSLQQVRLPQCSC